MTADPLAAAAQAFDAAVQQYRRAAAQTREGWNDEARRQFDARFGDQVAAESAAARRVVEQVRQELRRAVADLA